MSYNVLSCIFYSEMFWPQVIENSRFLRPGIFYACDKWFTMFQRVRIRFMDLFSKEVRHVSVMYATK